MAEKWNQLNLGKFYPPQLEKAADGLTAITENIDSALSTVRTVLATAQSLVFDLPSDPIEALIRASIEEILDALDSLAGDTAVHAIMLPIQKQFFGLGQDTPIEDQSLVQVTTNFDTMLVDGGFVETNLSDITPETIEFINGTDVANGGVRGYYRTFVRSQADEGDPARPRFNETFAVTGVSIVWGSAALDELNTIFNLFDDFVWLGGKSDPAARTRPIVENVRARVVPIPADGRIGVIVEWDPVAPVVLSPLYSNIVIVNKELFVIRSTDPQIRQRFSWGSNFPEQPSADTNVLPDPVGDIFATTEVVARIINDGTVRSYVDDDETLSVETNYYYAVVVRYAFRESIASPPASEFLPTMSNLSTVRQVFYTSRPAANLKSQPPDWFASPSLIQLFPVIADLIGKARLAIEKLLTRTTINSGLKQIIQQLIDNIDDLLEELQRINVEIARLAALLKRIANSELGAVAVTTFSVSNGGMRNWNSELARRLSDPNDPSRPAFDSEDLTGGMVIVAGAPNLAQLSATTALMQLLFGSSPESAQDRVIDVFGKDPKQGPVSLVNSGSADTNFRPTKDTDEVSTQKLFKPDVPEATPTPRFNDDFTAVDADEEDTPATPVFDESMFPSETIDCE